MTVVVFANKTECVDLSEVSWNHANVWSGCVFYINLILSRGYFIRPGPICLKATLFKINLNFFLLKSFTFCRHVIQASHEVVVE